MYAGSWYLGLKHGGDGQVVSSADTPAFLVHVGTTFSAYADALIPYVEAGTLHGGALAEEEKVVRESFECARIHCVSRLIRSPK